jgi:hypothetical protein
MVNTEKRNMLMRETTDRNKRTLPIIIALSLCLGAVFMVGILLLASCSATVSSIIKTDGSAKISVQADVPPALAAKFRKLAAAGSSPSAAPGATPEPLFNAAAIKKSIAARPGLTLTSLSEPNPESIRVDVTATSLEALAASPDLKGSDIITIARGPGWTECRFRLERTKAASFSNLLAGIDPQLLEALSPPALEEDPVSSAEYKTMLKSVLGDKAMPALEAAAFSFSLTAPGTVLSSEGGSLSGSTLSASIPMLEVLCLEKPIEIRLRWKTI